MRPEGKLRIWEEWEGRGARTLTRTRGQSVFFRSWKEEGPCEVIVLTCHFLDCTYFFFLMAASCPTSSPAFHVLAPLHICRTASTLPARAPTRTGASCASATCATGESVNRQGSVAEEASGAVGH